ncbi:MAG: isocitrate/isopropylmalate family dehydrogenase [Leuconostoc gelidum]|jgi:isocitrate/isopropylmalate dehydrogenase|uniref:isocitrate/isopropylmalate dehydrogenase family protein n=1 Tax=Leuconostoc gelidum TaxID=1244 RepID=UPI0015752E02|nr:isocitrate/isopropylmalate family dehydrogenase [Leuconostoc gelidum]MBZ5978763.1 isocitrate/isopropylmalate dehydrogenase family protein [Leuconostoc gelidum subsp. gelidum]MBZ6001773.1 isocitrate/isopropylmalate dehydrogenase family protein [Leuconostoc gelidum subsp. gelidum]QDJ29234.1 3-isopropylmalate dehydrogenase [Leuconostoc gelidum subsp. gelidum]
MKKIRVAVLPGDGIGMDVMNVCLPILKELPIEVETKIGDIGWKFWASEGNSVPDRTWKLIEDSDAVLVGAVTGDPRFVSPVIQLRQKLDLFANVRPIQGIKKGDDFDLYVIRENTEGLYAGYDFYPTPKGLIDFMASDDSGKPKKIKSTNTAVTIRLITLSGIERLLYFGFEWARVHGKDDVVIADKPNVFRNSSQLLYESVKKIGLCYPEINWHIENVDAVAMWMVKSPEKFQVIIAENQFGDILSDVGAAVMGGLGLAVSGNFGNDGIKYFEPVHGSAPKHAGKDEVNPAAMFLTIAMMLDTYGYSSEANVIKTAVKFVVQDKTSSTYDLGGYNGTKKMATTIIERVKEYYEK